MNSTTLRSTRARPDTAATAPAGDEPGAVPRRIVRRRLRRAADGYAAITVTGVLALLEAEGLRRGR